MSELQLIGTVLGAASFGAVVTVIAQLVAALRAQSREVAEAGRRVAELSELLKPSALRLQRIIALVDDSEPDLREVQRAVHRFSKGSVAFADNFERVSAWVGFAAPLLMAAFEGWAGRASSAAPEPGRAQAPADSGGARDPDGGEVPSPAQGQEREVAPPASASAEGSVAEA